jgi:hypothetical protein
MGAAFRKGQHEEGNMRKMTIVLLACVAIVGPGALKLLVGRAGAQSSSLPEYVPYMFLFDHHSFNLKKASELTQQGKDGTAYSLMFKRLASLTDVEAAELDQATVECQSALAQQDAQAQALIQGFRAKYPQGVLPAGQKLPPPPSELAILQQGRYAIILQARHRLHSAFGDQEFARFDAFVQSQVASRVTGGK